MSSPLSSLPILVSRIDAAQVGFAAAAVREIVRAVAIVPMPGAPPIIEGAINLRGRIVPVVDVRCLFGWPAVELAPEQFLIVLETTDRLIAVRVDDVEDVVDVAPSSIEGTSTLSPVLQRLRGVAATDGGALVIYDVTAFLTQAEQEALDLISSVTE